MKLFPLALPLALAATGALAQGVPAEAGRDLWCGLAFGIVSENSPTDVNEDQKAIIQAYADGGRMLVERGKSAYLANGYTEDSFATHLAGVSAKVTEQVNATNNSAEYSFEECSALLSL